MLICVRKEPVTVDAVLSIKSAKNEWIEYDLNITWRQKIWTYEAQNYQLNFLDVEELGYETLEFPDVPPREKETVPRAYCTSNLSFHDC